jgi:hypothetical protein
MSSYDVLRCILALRYNGLQSGIFCYAAMLNHSDKPNSVKFSLLPSSSGLRQTGVASEVRTTGQAIYPTFCRTRLAVNSFGSSIVLIFASTLSPLPKIFFCRIAAVQVAVRRRILLFRVVVCETWSWFIGSYQCPIRIDTVKTA